MIDQKGPDWDNPERPECTNLLTIYKAVTGKTKEEILADRRAVGGGGRRGVSEDPETPHSMCVVSTGIWKFASNKTGKPEEQRSQGNGQVAIKGRAWGLRSEWPA